MRSHWLSLRVFPAVVLAVGVLYPATEPAAQESRDAGAPAAASKKAGPADTNKPVDPKKAGAKPQEKSEQAEKAGGKPGAEKPSEPPVVKRPTEAPEAPDPEQFQLKPDEDGKVRFAFVGAPWPDLLRWLARISGKSLDWQELPADYLNLVTQRSYTIQEAQDVINRHLLARGFTLLRNRETLTVVNIKKLDAAMVPRVEPETLADRLPHEFVKVSFALDWLPAETAVKELKPMMSPNGKLSALTATNRIEAMDAVINLREVYQVLKEEQSSGGRNRLVRVFKLQHTRAGEVLEQLKGLLGIESDKSAVPMNPQQMARLQQQMRRMAQQSRGQQAPSANKPKDEIHLVVNPRENSILANAPPDKMAVIAQAIEAIDVPPERTPLLRNLEGVRVYRLNAIDPETLVKLLEKTGDLSPSTQLEVDEKNKAVIAFGTAVDHLTIRTLVDKLDGTNRRFEVIPLRKLEAEYVAGTIERMLGGEEEDRNSRGRSRYYYYFDPYRNDSDSESADKFRVDADIEFNRLLVWANEVELKEVENLLVKLGEIPPEGGDPRTVRVLDRLPDEERQQLLQRIQRIWPSVAPNRLLLPSDPEPKDEPDSSPEVEAPRQKPTSASRAADQNATFSVSYTREFREGAALAQVSDELPARRGGRQVQTPGEVDVPERPKYSGSPPPVSITRSPDGRLIIASQDTRALDRLEEIVQQIAPPRRDYKVFKLKYPTTWAWGVALNLEDFFKQEEDDSYYDPWWGYSSGGSSDDSRRLSKRRPPKFIADEDSHTILVQGATPEQLKVIEELIEIYDQPPDADPKSVRKTEMFHIKYSRAETIATAIKDVYRDLLSSNDPALAQNRQQKQQKTQTADRSYTYIYGGMQNDDGREPEAPIKFKGLLSVGVDELSNIVIISATERLLENIRPMVEALDEAAKPPPVVVRVVRSNGSVDPELVEALVQHAATGRPAERRPQVEQSTTSQPRREPEENQPAEPRGQAKPNATGGEG